MLDAIPLLCSTGESPHIDCHKLTLRGCKWKYRGEGNANIVIALPQREIMRLHKADRVTSIAYNLEETSELAEKSECERVWRDVMFCQHVMVPMLGSCYLQPPTAIKLDKSEVRQLNTTLQSHRPVHRHHKDVPSTGGYATLYPDYALLPANLSNPDLSVSTFCVEVKPKQAWVPHPDRILSRCTFCMKQYLKLKHGNISTRSNYCPLDLFSGDHERMQTALRALLSSPQNNLKIFKNGVLEYGEDTGNYDKLYQILNSWFRSPSLDEYQLVNKFCSLVLQALTRDLSNETLPVITSVRRQDYMHTNSQKHKTESKDLLNTPICDWNRQDLPANCVLDRILKVQMLEQPHKDWKLPSSPSAKMDYSYVPSLICDTSTYQSPLHRYLLAATAKDCSIMLAFQPVDDERMISLPANHIAYEASGDQHFVFNVGVSDLDPKPVSCFQKHRQRDKEMLMAYVELSSIEEDVRPI